ncbi:unnamed protein product [Chrysoparadoxa australica]
MQADPASSPGRFGRAVRTRVHATRGTARSVLPDDFYRENLLDKVALALFRGLVQRNIGFKSELPGYAGLVEEAQNYMVVQGATPEEQQAMVVSCLKTIAGPAVPVVYNLFMAPWPWAPFLTAFFTPPFFKFLVGPNALDVRKDESPGGVFVERCRFLEETNCKGLCLNMCKVPTEQFFHDTLGLDMTMSPDFETYECRLSFGLTPAPVDEDPDIPTGCLVGCSCKEAGANEVKVCSKV